jgi:gamma-glutamylcyclotransferase (GGCT)/AIG2-like uncharacterized protein YtfP
MYRFFVYGTLRPTGGNFEGFANLHDTGRTHVLEGYSMYDYGGSFPYAVDGMGGNTIIVTEVETDDPNVADGIDWMEAGAGYTKKEITVDGRKGIIYVATDPDTIQSELDLIPNGDWLKHKEEHGRRKVLAD